MVAGVEDRKANGAMVVETAERTTAEVAAVAAARAGSGSSPGFSRPGTSTSAITSAPSATGSHQQTLYDNIFCVVDLHALSLPTTRERLRANTAIWRTSCSPAGIDPEQSILFVQSDVREHSELCWLLSSVTQFGELRRMTQFKDKAGGQQEAVSAALFTYPVLQAADIILYDTDLVPVGEDQKQHVEMTRDIAGRFNARYGETFVLPEPDIKPDGARIMALDDPTKKMSKSRQPGQLRRAVRRRRDDPPQDQAGGHRLRQRGARRARQTRADQPADDLRPPHGPERPVHRSPLRRQGLRRVQNRPRRGRRRGDHADPASPRRAGSGSRRRGTGPRGGGGTRAGLRVPKMSWCGSGWDWIAAAWGVLTLRPVARGRRGMATRDGDAESKSRSEPTKTRPEGHPEGTRDENGLKRICVCVRPRDRLCDRDRGPR